MVLELLLDILEMLLELLDVLEMLLELSRRVLYREPQRPVAART